MINTIIMCLGPILLLLLSFLEKSLVLDSFLYFVLFSFSQFIFICLLLKKNIIKGLISFALTVILKLYLTKNCFLSIVGLSVACIVSIFGGIIFKNKGFLKKQVFCLCCFIVFPFIQIVEKVFSIQGNINDMIILSRVCFSSLFYWLSFIFCNIVFVITTQEKGRKIKDNNKSKKVIETDSKRVEKTKAKTNSEEYLSNSNTLNFTTKSHTNYKSPSLDLLKKYEIENEDVRIYDDYINSILKTTADFGINLQYLETVLGPSVIRFEFEMPAGVSIGKLKDKTSDLSYSLDGRKIRLLTPIPCKKAIGIEVYREKPSIVGFYDVFNSLEHDQSFHSAIIPMLLGKSVDGKCLFTDISKMPHLIIAGTTGSGKSVCLNTLINSIIFTKSPKEVRMLMVDPKIVELSIYNRIPHMLMPVVTEPKDVIELLVKLIDEMERRYKLLAKNSDRNLEDYNKGKKDLLPYILVIIDEFADIVASIGDEFEKYLGRLAAKARAVGIHLVIATQRPSADVITSTLKANFPGRIAFSVSSSINSRIIIDENGAENLQGKGDMLFLDPSKQLPIRIQGAYISTQEVDSVVQNL